MRKSKLPAAASRNHVARASVLLNRHKVVPDKRQAMLRRLAAKAGRGAEGHVSLA